MSMSNLDSTQCIKSAYDDTLGALKTVAVAGNFNIEITSNSYKHISSNTTTVVKSGAGVLAAISVNTAGGSSNIATIYDGIDTNGTVIGIIDVTAVKSLQYNIAFTVGLTIVTATGTAGDLTICYS